MMFGSNDEEKKAVDGFDALASHGDEVHTSEDNEKKAAAYNAVSRLFSAVKSGKLDSSILDQLTNWAMNPTAQSPSVGSQPSSGQPIGALGSGRSAPLEQLDDKTAMEHLWNSTTLDQGVQNALKRLFAPNGDPTRMEVKPDGTPVVVDSLRNEVRAKENNRAALETELDDERNENNPGSLAQKLKAATAAPATPADAVDMATLKTKVEQLREDEQHLETSFATNKIQGRDDLDATIKELEQLVS